MIIFKKTSQLYTYVNNLKAAGSKIGFVPTMGALHKGHLSLLEKSLSGNDVTVCSIFVNPTQFNDTNDFRKYPVTIEEDLYMLEQAGAGIVFMPDVPEIYPEGTINLPHFDLGNLETTLEGKFRPHHFQGVSQVMSRLLNIVQPHNLYMGQKDYQQCMVVQRVIDILSLDTILIRCLTQREESGLAMSSRNMRLNESEKQRAVTISTVLQLFKSALKQGDLVPLVKRGKDMLEQNNFKTDYVAITDAGTLEEVTSWNGKQPLVALIAAFIDEVRLIDNMILTE